MCMRMVVLVWVCVLAVCTYAQMSTMDESSTAVYTVDTSIQITTVDGTSDDAAGTMMADYTGTTVDVTQGENTAATDTQDTTQSADGTSSNTAATDDDVTVTTPDDVTATDDDDVTSSTVAMTTADDTDPCLEQDDPCNTHGVCTRSDDVTEGYVCVCSPTHMGENCQTEKDITTLSTRAVAAGMSLIADYSEELADNSSSEYTSLTDTLTAALTPVYMEKYTTSFVGVDNFVFRNGSIAAAWDVLVLAASSVGAVHLRAALLEALQSSSDGSLSGLDYQVVEGSVTAQDPNFCMLDSCNSRGLCSSGINAFVCQCLKKYTGATCQNDSTAVGSARTHAAAFKIVDTTFSQALLDNSTDEYKHLTKELTTLLIAVYQPTLGNDLLDVTSFQYSSGSIDVSYQLVLSATSDVTDRQLEVILVQAVLDMDVTGYTIDPTTVTVQELLLTTSQPDSDDSLSTELISLIVVSSCLLICVVVIASLYVWYKCGKNNKQPHRATTSSGVEEQQPLHANQQFRQKISKIRRKRNSERASLDDSVDDMRLEQRTRFDREAKRRSRQREKQRKREQAQRYPTDGLRCLSSPGYYMGMSHFPGTMLPHYYTGLGHFPASSARSELLNPYADNRSQLSPNMLGWRYPSPSPIPSVYTAGSTLGTSPYAYLQPQQGYANPYYAYLNSMQEHTPWRLKSEDQTDFTTSTSQDTSSQTSDVTPHDDDVYTSRRGRDHRYYRY